MPAKQSTASQTARKYLDLPWLELSAKITQSEDVAVLAWMLQIELNAQGRHYVLERVYGKLVAVMRGQDLTHLATGQVPPWIKTLL